MKKSVRMGGFIAFFLAPMLFGAGGDTQNSPSKRDGRIGPAGIAEWEMLLPHREILGTVQAFDAKASKLTLRIIRESKMPEGEFKPDPAMVTKKDQLKQTEQQLMNEENRIKQELAQLGQIKDGATRQRKLGETRQAAQKLQADAQKYKADLAKVNAALTPPLVKEYFDFDLKTKTPLVLRRLYLPIQFDEAGKTKEYTTAEKQKLKGKDVYLVGYEAKEEDFEVGKKVKVHFDPIKKKETSPPPAATDPAKKTETEFPLASRPVVRMIVLQNDEDNPSKTKKK